MKRDFDITAKTLCFPNRIPMFVAAAIIMCVANSYALSGYDENTQVVVSGTVKQVADSHPSGFKCIIIHSKHKNYKILTAPAWYAKKVGLNFRPGAEVQVVGSKFYTNDGKIYLMARSIKSLNSGRYIALRDNRCHPLWDTEHGKGESCLRIFFHPDRHRF